MSKQVIAKVLMWVCVSLTSLCATAQTGTITGKVSDAAGILAGATVSAGYKTAVTGAAGEFSLSINPGTYTIRVSYVGHLTQSRQVTVKAGETIPVDRVR